MENLNMPNMLLIAGTGRNSGKTALACALIKKFSTGFSIVAIKVTPHLHAGLNNGLPVYSDKNLYVAEELDVVSPKDSSRMLAAGARKSYFIMADDIRLPEAIPKILPAISQNELIICESGGLRNFVTPGLFFVVHRSGNLSPKPESLLFKELCDRWINFDEKGFDFSLDSVEITNNRWILNNAL